jgi:hypothetical protein
MELIIEPNGHVRCVYSETLDLSVLGPLSITRASHVEPDDRGCWVADLSLIAGPILGPFDHRSQALAAEQQWLANHWLNAAIR